MVNCLELAWATKLSKSCLTRNVRKGVCVGGSCHVACPSKATNDRGQNLCSLCQVEDFRQQEGKCVISAPVCKSVPLYCVTHQAAECGGVTRGKWLSNASYVPSKWNIYMMSAVHSNRVFMVTSCSVMDGKQWSIRHREAGAVLVDRRGPPHCMPQLLLSILLSSPPHPALIFPQLS